MNVLNLDPTFTPLGQGVEFEKITFAGGEPHIRLSSFNTKEKLVITTRIHSFNDVGFVLLAADAAKRMGTRHLELIIPYFPAARQDRVMVPGEPLTVKVYANLINQIGFEKVTVVDPHSEVTSALTEGVHVVQNHEFVKGVVNVADDYHLISPDGGALKKVHKLAQFLEAESVIECSKVRNVKTGKLSGFKVYCDDLEGKTCYVVDDICDGGGTFLGLADELKRKNAGKLVLIVTHGIFSKGLDHLSEKYDEMYCTNAFRDVEDERVTVINLNKELLK